MSYGALESSFEVDFCRSQWVQSWGTAGVGLVDLQATGFRVFFFWYFVLSHFDLLFMFSF
jgi:hypothetical protein